MGFNILQGHLGYSYVDRHSLESYQATIDIACNKEEMLLNFPLWKKSPIGRNVYSLWKKSTYY